MIYVIKSSYSLNLKLHWHSHTFFCLFLFQSFSQIYYRNSIKFCWSLIQSWLRWNWLNFKCICKKEMRKMIWKFQTAKQLVYWEIKMENYTSFFVQEINLKKTLKCCSFNDYLQLNCLVVKFSQGPACMITIAIVKKFIFTATTWRQLILWKKSTLEATIL